MTTSEEIRVVAKTIKVYTAELQRSLIEAKIAVSEEAWREIMDCIYKARRETIKNA